MGSLDPINLDVATPLGHGISKRLIQKEIDVFPLFLLELRLIISLDRVIDRCTSVPHLVKVKSQTRFPVVEYRLIFRYVKMHVIGALLTLYGLTSCTLSGRIG